MVRTAYGVRRTRNIFTHRTQNKKWKRKSGFYLLNTHCGYLVEKQQKNEIFSAPPVENVEIMLKLIYPEQMMMVGEKRERERDMWSEKEGQI